MKLNKKERQIYDELDKSFNYKENVIKVNRHNTFQHELSKFLVAWELMKTGQNIICEPIFKNGKRADILSLSSHTIFEIVHTEKITGAKDTDYPCQIMYLHTKDVLKNLDKELMKNV